MAQPLDVSSNARGRFRGYWIGLAILVATAILAIRQPTAGGLLGGSLVVAAALFPAFIWVRKGYGTIPVFALCTAVVAVTHGFPLLIAPEIVMDYSSAEQLRAGYTVAAALLAGTAAWYVARRVKRPPVTEYLEIPAHWGDRFFISTLGLAAVMAVAGTAGWTERYAGSGAFTAVRAALLASSALGALVLGYRHGRRQLIRRVRISYCVLLAINVLAASASLLLNLGISYLVLSFVGFSLGRRLIPWLVVVPLVLVFAILHAGKEEMRDAYWWGTESPYFTPIQYPSLYAEWAHDGINGFEHLGERSDSSSLLNRAELIYLLLHVQALSPDRVPYVGGASYAHIPALLVPRLLYPEKPGAHEGTILLNIHYGLQTFDSVSTATIGWGLLNEAYANFGFPGAIGVMLLLGLVLGLVERWSAGMPILSFRSLFAILLLSTLIGADATLAVFVAALAQGTVVLLAASAVLMRRRRLVPAAFPRDVALRPLAGASR
jgi:predicted small integral membrane protein